MNKKKYPGGENSLIVKRKFARWYIMGFFHFPGYRREHHKNGKLVVSKRKFDIHPPKEDHLS